MRIKIIATIFVCFFTIASFSQTKKLIGTFERHFEFSSLKPQSSCWGPTEYIWGYEDYVISLFSDSTFSLAYFKKGSQYVGYKSNEIAHGYLFSKDDTSYLVKNKRDSELFKSIPDKSRLDQVFLNNIPLKIVYNNDSLMVYNSAGPALVFTTVNFLDKYKNKRQSSSIFAFSPQVSNKHNSF
jgi:hypothetical protein